MNLTEGTRLKDGKYTIREVLGKGSFGITYLADAKFKIKESLGEIEVTSDVAVKEFFMSDISSRGENSSFVEGSSSSIFTNYRRKFRKEAENLSHLEHPNIIHVYDVFDENKTSYYVMEYIKGKSLDDYVTEQYSLGEAEAFEIIRTISAAVDYMHSNRVLHLDIKPKNIMMGDDGRLALIDFGLSKQFTETGEPESSTTIGMGTPGYAPLEQSQYKHTDKFPATLDVYALGATLYKMLTGKRPAEASEILNEGLDTGPLKAKNVSDETIAIVEKAMSPAQKDRYQNVKELLSALPDNAEKKSAGNDTKVSGDKDGEKPEEKVGETKGKVKDTVTSGKIEKGEKKLDVEEKREEKREERREEKKSEEETPKEDKNKKEEEGKQKSSDAKNNKNGLLKILIISLALLLSAGIAIFFLIGNSDKGQDKTVAASPVAGNATSGQQPGPSAPQAEVTLEDKIYLGEEMNRFSETASGLKYYIVREGSGKRPAASDNVEVHYRCVGADGHDINNTFSGTPVNINLGSILEGFREGVMLIGEGGRIILRIPPELGYGSQSSDITYDVELINVN